MNEQVLQRGNPSELRKGSSFFWIMHVSHILWGHTNNLLKGGYNQVSSSLWWPISKTPVNKMNVSSLRCPINQSHKWTFSSSSWRSASPEKKQLLTFNNLQVPTGADFRIVHRSLTEPRTQVDPWGSSLRSSHEALYRGLEMKKVDLYILYYLAYPIPLLEIPLLLLCMQKNDVLNWNLISDILKEWSKL